jgi:alpha-acetolactate decarboxylase
MKGPIFLIAVFSVALAAQVAHAVMPFELKYYGNLREIIKKKTPEGIIELGEALAEPHTYGVGVLKNAEGEITVLDGEVLLNYGKDGISRTLNQIPKGEKAMFLVTAQVEKWQKIAIPAAMSEQQLHGFVLEQARKAGLDIREPFPFLITGTFRDMVWNVMDGIELESGADSRRQQLLWKKLVGYKEEASGVLVGFYPASLHAEICHPGEHWHVHVLFTKAKVTGHVSAFSVVGGSQLELPLR